MTLLSPCACLRLDFDTPVREHDGTQVSIPDILASAFTINAVQTCGTSRRARDVSARGISVAGLEQLRGALRLVFR